MIDRIDRQIMSKLQANGRVSNADIARAVGMAPSAILERVRKLEERGYIRGYSAQLCPYGLNYGLLAYLFVRTGECIGNANTGDELAAIPEVQEVHHVAGEDCYLVKVRAANTEALGRLLRERIGAIANVQHTRTTIVLETLKETMLLPIDEPVKVGCDD